MVLVTYDRSHQRSLIKERRERGADHHDEVWNGVYVMSPDPNNEHQMLAFKLGSAFDAAIFHVAGAFLSLGCNISDRVDDWKKNYRVPDVVVFLPGNPAQDKHTHWLGGPDFAVEIMSPRDRSRKKLGFYASVGVRELLLVDRKPWALELYRLDDGELKLVGKISLDSPNTLVSAVLPVSFRLMPGPDRPVIEVTQNNDARVWLA